MAPSFPSPSLLALAFLALSSVARAYVLPDVSAATPAGCRCIAAAPTAANSGSFLAGTTLGCGPHPDPTGTFTAGQHWCLVDQTPALLTAAGGPCGQKVPTLGNVSACSGVAFSGVSVNPSTALVAGQPVTTFYTGQPITVTWSAAGFVAPEYVFAALVGGTGARNFVRIGAPTTYANATSGTFTGPTSVAMEALAPPVYAAVMQCKLAGISCTALNATYATSAQAGIVAFSSQALTVTPTISISEIIDNNGVSYTQVRAARSVPLRARTRAQPAAAEALTHAPSPSPPPTPVLVRALVRQPCANFTFDNRTISVTVHTFVQYGGSLVVALGKAGGGAAAAAISSVTIPAPAPGSPVIVTLGTGPAGKAAASCTITIKNTTAGATAIFTSSALTFTSSGSLAGVAPTGGACAAPSASSAPSATGTDSATPTPSSSFGATASSSISITPSKSLSISATQSKSPTISASSSVGAAPATASSTPSGTPALSSGASASGTPSNTGTDSGTPTPTHSPTSTVSATTTVSASKTGTPTPTGTPTASLSLGSTPSNTPSHSLTPSLTSSPTVTASPTVTPTSSPTSTISASMMASPSPASSPAGASASPAPGPGDCTNGRQDGLETGIDCGGSAAGSGCPACGAGVPCKYSTDCSSSAANVVLCANQTLTCTATQLGTAFYAAAPAIALDYTITVSGPRGVSKDGITPGGLDFLKGQLLTATAGAYASPLSGVTFSGSVSVRSVAARPPAARSSRPVSVRRAP